MSLIFRISILFLFFSSLCCLCLPTAQGAEFDTGVEGLQGEMPDFPPLNETGVGAAPPSNGGVRPQGTRPDPSRQGQPPGPRPQGARQAAPTRAPQPSQMSLPEPEEEPTPQNSRAIQDSLRSLMDQNNPFASLQLSSNPVDPNSTVSGDPLTIYEMLENVFSPHQRTQLLHVYWDLVGEIAKYKLAIQKSSQLATWTNATDTTHKKYPVLLAAAQLAQTQQDSQELIVLKKQAVLASLMKRTGATRTIVLASQNAGTPGANPIPVDLPFIGEYKSKVNQLVHYKPTGSDLFQMDKIIKIQRQLMGAKGQETINADALFTQVQKSQGSVESWIFTQDLYFSTYNVYLDAIIEYNRHIADYVKETVGPETTGRPLLTTIIQLNPLPAATPLNGTESGSYDPANNVPTVENY